MAATGVSLFFWHLANTSGATEVVTERLELFSGNERMLSPIALPQSTLADLPYLTLPISSRATS